MALITSHEWHFWYICKLLQMYMNKKHWVSVSLENMFLIKWLKTLLSIVWNCRIFLVETEERNTTHQSIWHFHPEFIRWKKVINILNETAYWFRKLEQKRTFKFFSAFDDPFFGITTLVDFTNTYHQSKDEKKSFFLYSVHFLLQCVNETEAFKLRIEGEQVVKYDLIHVSSTIGREDGTFGFGFFEYNADLEVFIQNAEK